MLHVWKQNLVHLAPFLGLRQIWIGSLSRPQTALLARVETFDMLYVLEGTRFGKSLVV